MAKNTKKRRKKTSPITRASLGNVIARVKGELAAHGVWTDPVQDVEIYLAAFGESYAEYEWVGTGDSGAIIVHGRSTASRIDGRVGRYTSLADILRHEYAHALANIYKGLIKSREFSLAFGASYDNLMRFEYHAEVFVTEYAATNAAEDFAETFMKYLKHDGVLPPSSDTQFIRRKWRFVSRFLANVRMGRSRFGAA